MQIVPFTGKSCGKSVLVPLKIIVIWNFYEFFSIKRDINDAKRTLIEI